MSSGLFVISTAGVALVVFGLLLVVEPLRDASSTYAVAGAGGGASHALLGVGLIAAAAGLAFAGWKRARND